MNRREFLKLLSVAVAGPGVISAIPASAPTGHTFENLYDLVRRRTQEARDDMAGQFEESVFRSTQVVAAVSSDGNYILLRGTHSWNPEWGAG